MASAPSASALSAVIRCRGNIFARNQANKKRPPPGSGYSIGLKCGAGGESGVSTLGKEHVWEACQTLPEWKSFFLGQRINLRNGVFLAVKLEPSRKNTTNNQNDPWTVNDHERKLIWQTGNRSDLSALVANVQHRAEQSRLGAQTLLFIPGIRKCLALKNYFRRLRDTIVWGRNEKILNTASPKVLCISISYSVRYSGTGEPNKKPVILCWNGWTTLKNRCIFLTALLSEILQITFAIENGRQSVPPVVKSSVEEMQTTDLVKSQVLPVNRRARKKEKDLSGESANRTHQRKEPGAEKPRGNCTDTPGMTTKVD